MSGASWIERPAGDGCERSREVPARGFAAIVPGCPFVYVTDPDGYEIEIWFE